MAKWESEFLLSDIGDKVQNEYRRVLSVGIDDDEAERLVIEQIIEPEVQKDIENEQMWLTLALCQWRYGRLSARVKAKAESLSSRTFKGISERAMAMLVDTLNSPMPERKKIRKPTVHHCPWPVGSLLAYRIISSEVPWVAQSKYYGKYVLLRIITIVRQPVSWLAPEARWNEQMVVGMYNWVGDTIPDPGIVNSLQYVTMEDSEPLLPQDSRKYLDKIYSMREEMWRQVDRLFERQKDKTVCLDWKCGNGASTDEVFTYLDCDESFQTISTWPPFFKTGVTNRTWCTNLSIDPLLVTRLKQLEEARSDEMIDCR